MAKADDGDKKTSIRIDAERWKAARVQALKDDMTVGDMLTAALDQYLKSRQPSPKKGAK